jgi:hypothetical protein
MFAFRCQRMFLLLACLQLALPLYGALAQDEGRPVHIHSDERRKVDETRVEDKGLKDERRVPEKAVTDIERAGREIDIKKNSNGEFLDANALDKLVKPHDTKETQDNLRPDEVKITDKIAEQIEKRGWTKAEIFGLLAAERSGTSIDGREGKNEPASVYGKKGEYIVINDRTKEIVQVSNKKDPEWKDDSRINWK